MKIVIGSDHAGFELKNAMGDVLRGLGHAVLDVGAFNENPSDYPDFAEAVGRAGLDGKAERRARGFCAGGAARLGADKPTRSMPPGVVCDTSPHATPPQTQPPPPR